MIKAGKARYIGASSMWAWQFAKLQHAAQVGGWTRFISMQDQYSLLQREEERDMFGRPLFYDSDKAIVDAVQQIARARGMSMATIALAWVLSNPVVSAPIVGATKPRHLADAVAALDIQLTDEEIQSLQAPYTPREPTYFQPHCLAPEQLRVLPPPPAESGPGKEDDDTPSRT